MKKNNKYVTIDEGVNYREIAATMQELGFDMNHSSVRNHVLRIMKKFIVQLFPEECKNLSDEDILKVIKTQKFQIGMCEILEVLESNRLIKTNEN